MGESLIGPENADCPNCAKRWRPRSDVAVYAMRIPSKTRRAA